MTSWLDSSAVLTLLLGEAGAGTVTEILDAAEAGKGTALVAQITLTEVASALAKRHGDSSARNDLRVLIEWPAIVVAPNDLESTEAGLLRARVSLSTADAIIAIQAMAAGAELVHKDPEFDLVPGLNHRRLPYKSRKR